MARRLHDLSEASPQLVRLRSKQNETGPLPLAAPTGRPPLLTPARVSFVKRLCAVYMTFAFPAGLLPLLPAPWVPYFICTWVALIVMAVSATFGKNAIWR